MKSRKNTGAPREKNLIRFFVDFYRRFPIPWWLFICNTAMGIVTAELSITLAQYLINVNKGELFNSVIISYALLYVLNSVLAYVENLFYDYGAAKVDLRARYVLWRHILHLPVKDIERQQPASLISAVTNDTGSSSMTIGYLFLMVSSLYGFARVCWTLYSYNAELSLYMLLLVPVVLVVFWAVGRTQAYGYKKMRVALNEMTMYFAEHVSAAKYVKAASLEDREIRDGYEAIERRYRAGVLYAFLSSLQVLMNSTANAISTVLIAVGGSRLISQGKMEQTGITDFSTYMGQVNQRSAELLTHYQTFKGSKATLGRVGFLLDLPVETPDKGEDWRQGESSDVVFENVHFGYTDDLEILHGVSLRIPGGKMTAVIGDNGSGKSTLLKLMQGFYLPNSGAISVAGNQVGDVQLHQLRSHFGYVLQENELFAASLRENMTFGMPEEVSDEQVEAAGAAACLDELAKSLPEGYNTVLGEGGGRLSGGQRQRIAIARALIQKPDYLLLDEAGSSLDYHTYAQIQAAVKTWMAGKTVVFIAHDMREILAADHVIVMKNGQVEATGTHEELAQTSETYRDYMARLSGKEGVRK